MTESNIQLPSYQIESLLHEGMKSLVYRGKRTSDQKSVILKFLRSEYPTFYELVKFQNQYIITKNLDSPKIVKPISLENYRNSLVLVMLDEGYISLSEYIKNHIISLNQCLKIGMILANILEELYQNRIIHKDIKPANILIHPQSLEIKLIDFSIASLLSKETQEIKNTNILEGTLAYISPEQTGRMNRGIDYRSDFYSLGVTLYELLSRKLPFASTDPMELIHSHIARQPVSVSSENIPEVVANIVMKLMAKNAEDRYQSALGLKYDLEKCLNLLETQGKIELFKLGELDLSDRFVIPEKLYGRESEVKQLLTVFERVGEGNVELFLVAGFSGIGKTVIVNEIHKPIVKQRGYFIKGKFDQFNRNVPFLVFVQAFRDLMTQLLSESDTKLQQWKENILDALGDNGKVIIEVIPELEKIIGKQPDVAELSGITAQNRFNLLFVKFIQVFTKKAHPLVIFIDDLQWADSASLQLVKLLMSEPDISYLLIIGAYRDNEVSPTHPLSLTLDEIIKQKSTINQINLAPLSPQDINNLVADTLSCSPQLAQPLTKLVYQKTKGNPFFTNQFITALYGERLISFNLKLRYWECDITQVQELILTDDVVEFMALQLQKLPQETQELLKLAACIGNQFDLATLAIVSRQSESAAANVLWRALQEGFILPQSQIYKFFKDDKLSRLTIKDKHINLDYKFLHDRVQQAAYSLIPEKQKQETHYQIGKLLLANLSTSETEEKIFDIVNQINIGKSLVTDKFRIEQLAKLNLRAGQKAKVSTAYAAAKNYFKVGISLLGKEAWKNYYDLTFQLYFNLAETELMSVEFHTLSETLTTLLKFANSPIEQAKIYVLKVTQYTLQGQFTEAIKVGLEGLNCLGITINRDTLQELVQAEFTTIEEKLKNRSVDSLLDLPTATNSLVQATIELLAILDAPTYIISDIELYSFANLRAVSLSLDYGNTPESIKTYINYGLLLIVRNNQYRRGLEFAEFALKLSYKFKSQSQQSKVCLLLGSWIQVWAKPIQGAAEINYQGFIAGLNSGDIQFGGYNLFGNICNRLFQGENLANLAIDINKYYQIAENIKNDLLLSILPACRFFINSLSQTLDEEKCLELVQAEQAWLERCEASKSDLALAIYYILQIHKSCLTQNFIPSIEYVKKAKKLLDACVGFTTSSGYYYYGSLVLLNSYLRLPETEKSEALKQIETNQIQLKSWSDSCPENFLHKYYLVEAERAKITEKKLEAMELYDKAIVEAKENQYIQEQALANELAAKFYLEWGKEKIAQTYLIEAYYCYAKWGAKAKTDALETDYPQLLTPIFQPQYHPLKLDTTTYPNIDSNLDYTIQTHPSNSTSIFESLDFAAIIQASQALSREIKLEELLSSLMEVVMNNAGAEKVVLLVVQQEKLIVQAIATATKGVTLKSIPLEITSIVPTTLINLVKRNLKTIFFDNVAKEKDFIGDPYFIEQKPKSIVCTPLLNQGKLIGVLYLENKLTIAAFTPSRLEIIKLICTQAAISIENAQLYRKLEAYSHNLEHKVEERTQALTQKTTQLKSTLKTLRSTQAQLIQSEKMSSLGQLVAGIAHEINNPINFIHGNLTPAKKDVESLMELIELYQKLYPQKMPEIQSKMEEIELDFVVNDLPKILSSMKRGSERIREIVLSLRNFSRLDESEIKSVDIHSGIDSTLLILEHRLKGYGKSSDINIKIIKEYGELPLIQCYASELNQVFMNIINNAIDTLAEVLESESESESESDIKIKPSITICTYCQDAEKVQIKIIDNGLGIDKSVQNRIFDPFFTTKPIGKGTGLGLSISYSIIVEKHGGQLTCNSVLGKGTEFLIEIPIQIPVSICYTNYQK
ncbi:MAG: AAA family ATPase [Microcoleaceae cyanobacterium MO_207.B10]|nr:AAA family ATPase [Microcoleaceae cyanobacterium MO_207.B10]